MKFESNLRQVWQSDVLSIASPLMPWYEGVANSTQLDQSHGERVGADLSQPLLAILSH